MEDLIVKRQPYSAEAEQAVLGSILLDPDCIADAVEIVKADEFYIPENRSIYEALMSMFTNARRIDPVLLLEELKTIGLYDDAGGRAYLYKLMESTPSAANIKAYARIVHDKAVLRRLASVTEEVRSKAIDESDDAGELLELAEQKLYDIRNGRESKGLVKLGKVLADGISDLNELARVGGGMTGITTGFSDLDNFINGFNKGDLLLLAARPAVGKTSIALNMARNAAVKSGKDVAIFNLEMPRVQLAMRLLSSEASVDLRKLRTAEMDEAEWERVALATQVLSPAPIYIDDTSNISVADMKARCRSLKNLGLVVVDYLQLMSTGRKDGNRVLEVGELSRAMKIMAKELEVPILCLSQLSRAPEKRTGDKRPMLSDLRDSGSIEQDADIVMFLYRDEDYNPDTEDKNVVECIVAKNRNGQTGTVKFQWLGQFTKFSTQDRIHGK